MEECYNRAGTLEPKKTKTEKVEYAEPVWKLGLFKLQQEAPKCHAILVPTPLENCPSFYGREYHGAIGHEAAKSLLKNEGDYLIRQSPKSEGFHTLSLRICNEVRHYKLYYDGKQHFIHKDKRKCFNYIEDLVTDGIVIIYVESKAGSYIKLMHNSCSYENSPYVTLTRGSRRNAVKPAKTLPDVAINYEKMHSFKPYSFKGFYWCEYCGNFLWGFINQGVKCEDCGFNAHFKCSEKLPADCCPDLKQLRGVFGVDLTTLVKAHKTTRPFVVDKCIKEIQERGLDTEGLYRISGYQEDMDNLRMAFEKDGVNAEIGINYYDNINVVASILKLYFRLLPIPLITFDVHPVLLKAIRAPKLHDQILQTKLALCQLPPAHYNTLKYLMEHLHRVTKNSAVNKMTSQNVSTVFAPSIMPPPDLDKNCDIPDLGDAISTLQLLITHHDIIFN